MPILTYSTDDSEETQSVEIAPDRKAVNLNKRAITHLDLSGLGECVELEALFLSQNNLTTIDLSPLAGLPWLRSVSIINNRLSSVDLGPLASSPRLESLNLSGNNLFGLDLSPLSRCERLNHLDISQNKLAKVSLPRAYGMERMYLFANQLSSIDLSPLESSSRLEILVIDANMLKKIDLAPLASCPYLRQVSLGDNMLSEIDLTPLSYCPRLGEVNCLVLSGNPFKGRVDVSPLMFHPLMQLGDGSLKQVLTAWFSDPYPELDRLLHVDFEEPSEPARGSWKWLKKLAVMSRSLTIQRYILRELGLSKFGHADFSLNDVFLSLSSELSVEKAAEEVRPHLVDGICTQIDRGGTTIDLDLIEASSESEIAIRASRILEMRDAEMRRVFIRYYIRHNFADLGPLWLTAYGNRILSGLKVSLQGSRFGDLSAIEAALHELGHELRWKEVRPSGEWVEFLEDHRKPLETLDHLFGPDAVKDQGNRLGVGRRLSVETYEDAASDPYAAMLSTGTHISHELKSLILALAMRNRYSHKEYDTRIDWLAGEQ